MTDQDKTINNTDNKADKAVAAAGESHAPVAAFPREAKRFVWLALVSLTLTILAWILGGYSAIAAIITSAAAIVTGAFALKSHRHGVRNTAITSIIAAAALLVVISAFCLVIYIGLKSV